MPDPSTERLPQPLTAAELQQRLNAGDTVCVIDVREAQELEIAPFPGPIRHLPLSGARQWMDALPDELSVATPVVVICHAGVRSWQFGCWLLQQRPDLTVWNLEGGIDAWSVQVDPSVPRY